MGSSWAQVGGRETGVRPQQYWEERLASWGRLKNTVPAIIRKSRRIVLPVHHRTRKPGIRPTQVGLTEPQVALKLGSSWAQVGGREMDARPQQYRAERSASWGRQKRTVPAT
ncbi:MULTISPECIES: hypothetical protein [Photorhabdus]|uniref:Uncharacterized protein n=1 Tax=Photorhabdus bodei TaxID=2029681 RepID=A0AAW6BQ59_9GAMM|nr:MULTISPECIES: hypothetical protein [Photorhabdus]MCC8423174.1 hypothetical protein [Photorhabdus thracensis]MCT8350147.1 hypothetical protein [Photorhabdus temperata]MDB6374896.1 hypothetical protein [Photorhabdus bodei]